ncbi:selenocysteine-specific translation elongation factor [Terrisporobacter mayombei]|uniref:Selenocysteine-specific elongation factor n=1 Tax=Terrisporobacter mayombei TaxID=1541 RepID=A0ABY9Q7Y6_9FIRM|nr:selenocysteine-specific translation elongation factor [Terrisporobacter mayombei]MCC3870367.1 selenocysteine-specific translation elongation factor [Terrisporobacter mayombei]WMT83623.1 Selenocysteine-specific elongation factor [Terrisporobacter mayombei]
MKNIIIGTAGHIDHGKTALIRALTGKETDRWEEEKRRGITIDLGFTYFDLPSGDRAGIIDVPGHEKFVNNMLAGVIGMDLVMLVVAADEGMMPQTREHVDIMSQLGVDKSIVVLNKCDLVDDEWKELVKEEIKEELIGSVFENANMIEVSSVTGEGIDNLIQEITHMTKDELSEKDINTIPRLPIDRSFSISGFGTIVTGTLISGSIKKDDELEIYPTGKKAKIRSIQVHGKDVKECFAGQRSAINISNFKKDEIKRGYVLAPPNSLEDTMMLDVKLNVLNSSERILSNRCRLHLFTGTSEVLCRAVLLDVQEASPGDSCYAQLRLEEKIAVRRGDKFIVRFYSPLETVGGGVILDANPTKKTPFNKIQLEEIKRKEEGSHSDIVELLVKKHPEMITAKEIGKLTGLSVEEVSECINELKEENLVLTYEMKKDIYVYHSSEEMRLKRETIEFIKNFHDENPYKFGVGKSLLKTKLYPKIKQNVFDQIIYKFILENEIKKYKEYLSLNDFEINKDKTFQNVDKTLVNIYKKAEFDFVRLSEINFNADENIVRDILNVLIDEEKIVRINEEMFTLKYLMDKAEVVVREKLEQDNLITISQLRDALNTSRKSAKPMLEYFDNMKITRKNGAESERVAY